LSVGLITSSVVFAAVLLYLGFTLAQALTPSPPPYVPEAPPQQWFMTFRAVDVVFLALAVFAATLGVAALFRFEGERPGPEEEVLMEGEVEEPMGEEEEV